MIAALLASLVGVVILVATLFFAVSFGRRVRFGSSNLVPAVAVARRGTRTSNARGED